ncbi:hypothetical protein [Oerskovia flava]|uniref:hypothetical protein n=1 Tax=Oerskovia flava TaxID=2986422 RepID=UPI00223F504C|nr:hypothetical protein [Oerskovia sp. JB1-3-2]
MTSTRTSGTARFAAAGLLALGMMLPLSATATATPEVRQLLADAQVQTETINTDLDRVEHQLPEIPALLRHDITDAVESVHAATDEARAALDEAADPLSDGRAAVALADAQVALDAASAQLRYVTDLAAGHGEDVTASLLRLQAHIDELRGETSRAGV